MPSSTRQPVTPPHPYISAALVRSCIQSSSLQQSFRSLAGRSPPPVSITPPPRYTVPIMQSLICGALSTVNKLDRKDAAKVKQIERREIEEKVDIELEDERKVKKRKKRERKRKVEEEERVDKRRKDRAWDPGRYKPCRN